MSNAQRQKHVSAAVLCRSTASCNHVALNIAVVWGHWIHLPSTRRDTRTRTTTFDRSRASQRRMSSSAPAAALALPLADRLVAACCNGDLPSAEAAVADGASVNERGKAPDWDGFLLPLAAAAGYEHHDVVVWLLLHGADPNGDEVMKYGACHSAAAILQRLVDAGGDVNRNSDGELPLFWAAVYNSEAALRVLLAAPALDLNVKVFGKSPEQFARDKGGPVRADMIAQEVGGAGLRVRVDWTRSTDDTYTFDVV